MRIARKITNAKSWQPTYVLRRTGAEYTMQGTFCCVRGRLPVVQIAAACLTT